MKGRRAQSADSAKAYRKPRAVTRHLYFPPRLPGAVRFSLI